MRASEWIVLVYFVGLAGAAAAAPLPSDRRRRIVATALLIGVSVLVLAHVGSTPPARVLRAWMPLGYILLGYWLPALLVTAPDQAFERRLLALDHRWFGPRGLTVFVDRAPRIVIELLELAYLFCYPLMPIGFACLNAAGIRGEADRFWTAVVVAAFGCYGVLPWLPTRPPRAIENGSSRSRSSVRSLNLAVLGRASVRLNTFPSGHVATSLATALAVGAHLPLAGLLLGVLACAIAVGSVVGRYHYTADALAGALVGLIGFAASRLI